MRWVNLTTLIWLVVVVALAVMGSVGSGDVESIAEGGVLGYLAIVVLWAIPRSGFRRSTVKLVLSPEERRSRRKLGRFDYAVTAGVVLWEAAVIVLSPRGSLFGYALIAAPIVVVLLLYAKRPAD